MGRLPILTGELDADTGWLDRAVKLSPSFAKAHYSGAQINVAARDGVGRAVQFSPLDPLMGPLSSVRALALLIDGRLEDAREQSLGAVRAGPSHVNNVMQSAAICALAGKAVEAAHLAAWVRERRLDATVGLYLSARLIPAGATRARLERALLGLGFPS